MKRVSYQVLWLAAALAVATAGATLEAQTPVAAGPATLGQSRVFAFDQIPVRATVNGGESRDVLHGALATGEVVGMHESVQPAGAEPVPLHPIQHSELIMVREGTVAFEHDGRSEKVGPGGVIYVALGTVHRIKNVGDGPAKYFVLQIGGDTKK